jgi:UDP-glucose 4-epimerase
MISKKILITGTTGFIGGHILRRLSESGFQCVAVVRKSNSELESILEKKNIFEGNIEDLITKQSVFKDVRSVIHGAARVHQMQETAADPASEYRKVNIDLTMKLAEKALEAGVERFIFLSSVKVMGDECASGKIIGESDVPKPTDLYGSSKLEAEERLRALFGKRNGAACTILRLPMVYGEGNKGNMTGLLRAASRKIPLPIGAVTGKRSMVYVGNVADAVLTVVSAPASSETVETFYLTDGEDYSSAELYSAIFSAMNNGKTGLIYIPAGIFRLSARTNRRIRAIVSRLFDDYRFSSERFRKRYTWNAPFSLKQGVGNVVTWYKSACTQ